MDERKLLTIKNDRKQKRVIYYNYQNKIFYKLNYDDFPRNNKALVMLTLVVFLIQPTTNFIMKTYQTISQENGVIVRALFLISLATITYYFNYHFNRANIRNGIKYFEEVYVEEELIKSYRGKNKITAIVSIIIILSLGIVTLIVFLYVLNNPNSNILPLYWVGAIIVSYINFFLHPLELYKFSRRKDYTDLDQYKKMKEKII